MSSLKKNQALNNLEIKSCQSSEFAIALAAKQLISSLENALQNNAQVLLLLSGGSNLKILDHVSQRLLNNSAVTIYVLDERFSADPTLNNSLQIKEKNIHIHETVPKHDESLDDFASKFNQALVKWLAENPGGKIICTLGMGPDGHIAGISPMPSDENKFEGIFNGNELVVGYSGNLSPAERVTTTFKFLSKVDLFIALITGEAKKEVFDKFIKKESKAQLHPVQYLHQLPGKIIIYTDLC